MSAPYPPRCDFAHIENAIKSLVHALSLSNQNLVDRRKSRDVMILALLNRVEEEITFARKEITGEFDTDNEDGG